MSFAWATKRSGTTYSGQSRKVDKKPWRQEEDTALLRLVAEHGTLAKWTTIASRLGSRTGKQCRERFLNHLNPDIKKTAWTDDEDALIMKLHEKLGNHWCQYTDSLRGRTDCSIKNRFHVLTRNSQRVQKTESDDTKGSEATKVTKITKYSKAAGKRVQTDTDVSMAQRESAMMAADEDRTPLIGSSGYMNLSSSTNADAHLSIEIPPADPHLNELEQEFVNYCNVPGGSHGAVGSGENNVSGSSQSTRSAYQLNTLGSMAGLFALDSLSNEALNTRILLQSSTPLFSPPGLRHYQQPGEAMNSITSQHWFTISPLYQAGGSPLTPMIDSFGTPNLPPLKRQKISYPYNYVAPARKINGDKEETLAQKAATIAEGK